MSDLGTAVAAAPGHRSGPAEIARDLVLASRPLSWINTALPFLAASFAALQGLDVAVLLGFAYFLVPYNLLMYGVNDIFDYESDLRNPRKRSAEGGLVPPDRRRITWLAIAVTNVPCLVALAVVAPPAGTAAVLLAVAAAIAYSAPPLRTKERAFLDSATSASHSRLTRQSHSSDVRRLDGSSRRLTMSGVTSSTYRLERASKRARWARSFASASARS